LFRAGLGIIVASAMLHTADLDLLACPECPGAPLESRIEREARDAVMEAALTCTRCRTEFTLVEGIPWLLPIALRSAGQGATDKLPDEYRQWADRLFTGFRKWREKTWTGDESEQRERSRKVAETLRDAFVKFCGPVGGRVLEVGCGSGYLTQAAGFRPGEYWGIDPMPEPGGRYDFRFVAAIGERLPFASGIFRAVVIKDSLHHFQHLGKVFAEARRVIEAGGVLLVSQGFETAAGKKTAGAARVMLHRAGTAAKLLGTARIGELRKRAGKMMTGGAAGGGADDHFLWHLTSDDIVAAVSKEFQVARQTVYGQHIFLEGRV